MQPPQFIVWRSVPNPSKPKPDKIPFNLTAGKYVSAHDTSQHMTRAAADALVSLYSSKSVKLGVAFVLTANDDYFCIDLDKCLLPSGEWSPFALAICALFPGAMIEVSHGGDGLHIWGRGVAPAGHRTRSADVPGLEVYTSLRSMALGTNAQGDSETVHTDALTALLEQYLPGQAITRDDWTTAPVAEWRGPDDDTKLIERMLSASTGVRGMTGGAALPDLWDGDAVKIAQSYPSVTEGEPYDASAADSALCSHLAWWTGKQSDRIDRLFRQSKLMRDKWEREDYRTATICGAAALVTGCYKQPGVNLPAVTGGASMVAQVRTGSQMLDPSEQMEFFKGCVWVRDVNAIMVPDGALLKQGQFNAAYGGFDLALGGFDGSGKYAKTPWEAFTDSRAISFPKVHTTCFRPDSEPGAVIYEENEAKVNIYQPLEVASTPGDVSPFLDLLQRQFPDDRDRLIILSYAAACVQYKGAKFQWAPLVQGVEGNGKTFIATCISYAIGLRHCHTPNAQDISNKFNAWVKNNIFAVVEEVYTRDRFDCTEALKKMITNRVLEDQGKGGNQGTVENCVKYFLTTNHRDAIIKTRNDRRYAVFYMAQQYFGDLARDGMDGTYFPDLHRWLFTGGAAIVTHFLQNYAIPDEFNPASNCNRAPETSSTNAAIEESLGVVEQSILEAVSDDASGFTGGYVSSVALLRLMQNNHYKIGPRKRNSIMEALGYVKHPGLANGRTTRCPSLVDGQRITLYVKEGSPLADVRGGETIIADYVMRQGWSAPVVMG